MRCGRSTASTSSTPIAPVVSSQRRRRWRVHSPVKARPPMRVPDALTLLTQAVAVVLAAAAVVSPMSWRADSGGLPDVLRVIAALMLAAAAASALPSASGVRRPLLGGLAVAWACGALHQITVGIGVAAPTLRIATVAGFYLGIVGGCAFALGWRRRGTWRELSLDMAMLACAAAVVGISLGYVVPGGAVAIGPSAAIAFARRSASVAALLVVALLLASQGERLGRGGSTGIAVGTLALAVADELPVTPTTPGVQAVLWAAALFAIAYAVRALAVPEKLAANGAGARRPEITGSATVRARFLLVAT